MANDAEKEVVARASLKYVKDSQIVGLGTGSTATIAIRLIGERVRAGLKIRAIPTSIASRNLASQLDIPLTNFEEVQEIDVTIDGADEFDPARNLIKGGGGAMLREKIVASASRRLVIVTDSSKQVPMLGKFPVPVEVIGFAERLIAKKISELGAEVVQRQDSSRKPYLTDEKHHILDCHFGQIPNAPALARTLSEIPGVVEHGLFVGTASVVLMAKAGDVEEFGPAPSAI
jgi:ribose 5-phosphate isomerase A